jgi:hypothetical protein
MKKALSFSFVANRFKNVLTPINVSIELRGEYVTHLRLFHEHRRIFKKKKGD